MDINEMAKLIEKNGGRLYLVGGAVRDKYFGVKPNDNDYCITGLTSKQFENLFPKAHKRGKAFCVYDIDNIEFALARIDTKIGKKHTDFDIESNSSITIQQDLSRRDITINSMAIDVLTGELIDPFNGLQDIKDKIARATSKAFAEDALRVYRIAVLATKYNLKIEENTLKMMSTLNESLKYISGERVLEELKKALRCNKPSVFFQILRQVGCLQIHFKEISDLIGVKQPIEYHPEGDAYNHTMDVLDRCAQMTESIKIRFSALTHDLGKTLTNKCEWPHHYNHEILGCKCINDFCNRLKVSNLWRKSALTVCKEHMIAGNYCQLKNGTKVDFFERVIKSRLGLNELEIIVNADKNSNDKIEFAKIGEYIINNINGKEMSNTSDYNELKEKVRAKRIKYLNDRVT